MGTFRGLPPEVLETLGLDPEGDEDEPDEPSGPYELCAPHRGVLTAEGGGRSRRRPARRISVAGDPAGRRSR